MILSIVVPMYNAEYYIERCLNSTINQDIPKEEYEVIVINDGSSDHSASIVNEIICHQNNIRLYSQKNMGLSSARNAGIRHSSGDYILFLDSDDYLCPNSLLKVVNRVQNEKPDVLCICAADVKNGLLKRRFLFPDEAPKKGSDFFSSNVQHCAPFYVVSASYWAQHHFHFKEGIFHEDSELIPRVIYYASKISFINDLIYLVNHTSGSITRTINPKRSFDLINYVCPSLSIFSKEVSKDKQKEVNRIISSCINTAISLSLQCGIGHQFVLEKDLYDNRNLFSHLIKSGVIKYEIEYMLFAIFPRHTIPIYKLLNVFRP